jgi:hypothetical protein
MSLLNSVVVATKEVNSQGLLKALLLLLSPNLRPKKLGITKKIPNRTLVIPKDPGNNNDLGFSPLL